MSPPSGTAPSGTRRPTPNAMRDAWEDALLTAAIEREVPFLGICRGLQVLNVNRGGTLLQHLPEVVGDDRYNKGGGNFSVNKAEVSGGRIGGLLDDELDVKSYHHQAVDELGDGLAVSARTGDGTVYAIELPDHPFGVAVQWHPEEDAAGGRAPVRRPRRGRARTPEGARMSSTGPDQPVRRDGAAGGRAHQVLKR